MAGRLVEEKAGVLLELVNLITLLPSDNPQARAYEEGKTAQLAVEAGRILPTLPYSLYVELAATLDQRGSTFDCYVARQLSTLYFLLRLAPMATGIVEPPSPTDKRFQLLAEGDEFSISEIAFPEGVLEDSPAATSYRLLSNYLVEQWNWYCSNGPINSTREAVAIQRLYLLVRQVVQAYGWWSWPFFHHHNSSEHVDQMLKLVEDSDGRFPLSPGPDRSDLRPDVRGQV